MKPTGAKQSVRKLTHSNVMRPLTARSSEDRGLARGEAGAIARGVAAYYNENPEKKQPWKKTRHAIARNPNRIYP